MPSQSPFPKPLAYLGFFLIAAACLAGIYKTFIKKSSPIENTQSIEVVVDSLFQELKNNIKRLDVRFDDSLFEKFVEKNKKNVAANYLALNKKLLEQKLSASEALLENKKFNETTLTNLKNQYLLEYQETKN